MKRIDTAIPDLVIIEPRVFGDERGFFFESFNARSLAPLIGEQGFVQDNHSRSATGVLRGHPGRVDPELPARLGRLTPRELEVLRLVADGRSNKWIAETLSLSALTVKSHLSRISRKLGTGDRSHQVAVAMRAGVLL